MMKNFLSRYWAILIPLIVLIIALVVLLRRPSAAEEEQLIGMVDASFVDVAAALPGRLDSLLVATGDTVQQGQLLGVLHTKEIKALNRQALAVIDVARNQLQLLQKGPRPELVRSAGNVYDIAQEQYELARKTYDRIEQLYQKEVVSGEERDIIYFKLRAAEKEMETARLNQEMLQKGTQPEMLSAAAAILRQAEEAYELTSSITENTHITAPADGIISTLVIHEGEIVSIGYPIITLQKKNSYFARFNVRQDKMQQLSTGAAVELRIPGCEPERIPASVTSIAPTLTFANWVPAKDRGQFELRTFTVECTPLNPAAVRGLRPGMTAALLPAK
jgi:HlyD family secretion protein